jgi:hypothetical protein
MRIFAGQSQVRIRERLLDGDERELGVAIDSIGLSGGKKAFWVEVKYLSGHLASIAPDRERIEAYDTGDARTAGQRRFPEIIHPDSEGGHDT